MVSDIIIIYLACGAPLGVYKITSGRAPRTVLDWASFANAILFWPVFVTGILYRLIRGQRPTNHERLDQIRREIEELAFPSRYMSELFDFREVFYRFTGLAQTALRSRKPRASGIFAATGHGNVRLAEKCLARRDSERLAFHTERAGREFSELISARSTDVTIGAKLSYLASQIAQLINYDPFRPQTLAPTSVRSATLTGPGPAAPTLDSNIACRAEKRLRQSAN